MFTYVLQNEASLPVYDGNDVTLMFITVGLSLVNLMAPMDWVNEKIFPLKDEATETKSYEEARYYFGPVSKITYFENKL